MKNRNRAIFPGTFDPITNGHVDLVKRALRIFDQVTIGVLFNVGKASLFAVEERVELIEREFESYGASVVVKSFSGLLADFAKQMDTRVIIRGLRAISDYDYEAQMALMNKSLWEEMETFFLMAREENSYVSSSLAKQISQLGGSVSRLVSPRVEEALRKKYINKVG